MKSAISNLIRVCVAIAMGFGFGMWTPAGDYNVAKVARQCGCNLCAGTPACCIAPEDPTPAQQPVAPASRDASEGQPLALADRPAVMIRLPEATVIFSEVDNMPCASVAGHSFQSVRCMWLV